MLSRSPSLVRAVVLSACFAVAGLVAAAPASAATYSCTPPKYPETRNKGGYFAGVNGAKKYKVSGYSRSKACSTGRAVILAYHRCRIAKGLKGSCSGRTFRGLKCTDRRDPDLQIPTELNASVTCRKGSKRVAYIYQQNL